MEDRDPFFIACFNGNHQGYRDDPQFTLIDERGELLLRTGEQIFARFGGDIMMLRHPEQRWLINNEIIHDWTFYFTTERIVVAKKVNFPGAFEFFDHIETYGKFAGLHPTEEISIKQFFGWLDKKDKQLQKYTLVFQLAYSRLSMVSCLKMASPDITGIDVWYEDAPNASQTDVQIFPQGYESRGLYELGVRLNGAVLKEKQLCLENKHKLDPQWEIENYNTHFEALMRLVKAPDFLAMGSGSMDAESYDPITFQADPLIWNQDVFSRAITGKEPIRIVNLKY